MAFTVNTMFSISVVFLLVILTSGASLEQNQNLLEKKEIRREVAAATVTQPPTPTTTPLTATTPITTTVSNQNCTDSKNGTDCHPKTTDDGSGWTSKFPKWMDKNRDILKRTMYVLVVLTVIVVLYFLIKMFRLRRRRSKSRRYGVLSTGPGDNLEMTPLDQDDDEDDMTVFEVNGHRK